MIVPQLITFAQALERTADGPRAVLLGNGFSIAQSGQNFAYSSLLERSGLADDSPIRKLFGSLQTVDFEEVMRSLEHAALVESAYGEIDRSDMFRNDADALRAALIHAIREVHPGIQFEVPEAQIRACGDFVNKFAAVFTLNYDLLLYWVILNANPMQHFDGFAFGREIEGFRTFDVRARCTTYYLHGALHLFLNKGFETRKRVKRGAGRIIDKIENSIRTLRQLPMFVAEGTTEQKKSKIYSIPYLRHCYEQLRETEGSLFVLGHSASEKDEHIYDAIFESGITQFVFCAHQPQDDWGHVRERLAHFRERRDDVEFIYVDAASANVWG